MKMLRSLLLAGFGLICAALGAQAQGINNGIPFTPVVQNAAYSSGNAIGGLQTISGLQPAQSGIFSNLMITSKGGSTTAMTFYIFDTNPSLSTCTDKSAFVLNNADVAKLAMAPFVLTPAIVGAGTTATVAQLTQAVSVRNQDVPIKSVLYICIVVNGAVTPASTSDLVGKLSVAND